MNGLFIHGLTADTVQREAIALLKGNGRPLRVAIPPNSNPWLQRIVNSGASGPLISKGPSRIQLRSGESRKSESAMDRNRLSSSQAA